MLVATWNVNSLKARLPRVLEFLERHQPDVVCLQETKCPTGAFPSLEVKAAGYTHVDHSAGRWAGVAILARDEPNDVVRGLDGEPDAGEARWVEAAVAGLRVVSVYVINGRSLDDPMFAAKLAFLDAARDRLATLAAEGPLVVAGDFNVAPSDLDAYGAPLRGATHVSPQERSRFVAILEVGLVDAFRAVHPDEVGYTWWDYRAGHFHRGVGMRIDLALVSRDLAGRIVSCGIDRDFRKGPRPSDHAPLLLELRDEAGRPPGGGPPSTPGK